MKTRYQRVRQATLDFCSRLNPEDHVIQPVIDVSPPKWHMAHTTWFFETFVLKPFAPDYKEFDSNYNFLFNSYYEGVGQRTLRHERGFLSRPTVDEVLAYRAHVDKHMTTFLSQEIESKEIQDTVELGLQHEQQHQELLVTDTKYSLGSNPIFPVYDSKTNYLVKSETHTTEWIPIKEEVVEIGHKGDGFCFDNELSVHKALLQAGKIHSRLVTN
ncbi:MAG: DinB family protein, partial [Bacteroidota bacterium]